MSTSPPDFTELLNLLLYIRYIFTMSKILAVFFMQSKGFSKYRSDNVTKGEPVEYFPSSLDLISPWLLDIPAQVLARQLTSFSQ